MKVFVHVPSCVVSACCASSIPVKPVVSHPGVKSTIMAEDVHTSIVST